MWRKMWGKKKINKYPYIILGIVHLIMLLYTFYKNKDRKKLTVLLLSYIGFAYIFEYIIVSFNQAYLYKPHFLKQKDKDNIMGAVLSQFFYVPTVALFITTFKLGWKAKLMFSVYFVLIEKLFIRLGIFKNKWWLITYTFLLIPISFVFNDKWLNYLKKGNSTVLFLSLFQMIQVTWMNMIFVLASLLKIKYGSGKIKTWKEHFIVAPIVGLIKSLYITIFLKENFNSKINVFLVLLLTDLLLIKNRLLKVKNIGYLLIIYLFNIFFATHYRRMVYKHSNTIKQI